MNFQKFSRQAEAIRYYEMDALIQVNHELYIYNSGACKWTHFKGLISGQTKAVIETLKSAPIFNQRYYMSMLNFENNFIVASGGLVTRTRTA